MACSAVNSRASPKSINFRVLFSMASWQSASCSVPRASQVATLLGGEDEVFRLEISVCVVGPEKKDRGQSPYKDKLQSCSRFAASV